MLSGPTSDDADGGPSSVAGYRVSHQAMATQWWLYAFGAGAGDCEPASEVAFEEVDRVESRLSYFLRESDIGQLNRAGAGTGVDASTDTLECLMIARAMHKLTGGAFDPTVGALLSGREPWHTADQLPPEGRPPEQPAVDRPGFEAISIDRERRQLRRSSERVELDLGAIGKGFAVDRALAMVGDWLIGGVMLVAGQSTMRAMGPPPGDQPAWVMTIRDPRDEAGQLDEIGLTDAAISAAASGESGHVLDPRTGQSAAAAIGAWAVAGSGAVSDALATAGLVMSAQQLADCCHADPTLALARLTPAEQFETFGRWNALRDTLGTSH